MWQMAWRWSASVLSSRLLLAADVRWLAQRARKQREEGKARKAERQKKSLVVQKITNPATLKRMMKSKKERKKLIASDTV